MSDKRTIRFEPGENSDYTTNAVNSIDFGHHEIHAGDSFTKEHLAVSKNDGETINIYLKTANTAKWCHMFMGWSSGGAAYGRIYEAPTITANTGTNGQAVFNRNRNSTTISGVFDNATSPVVNKTGIDVTKTGDGTIIYTRYTGAAKKEGGEFRAENEFMLKPNTAYLFEVESDAAGITLSLYLNWYEHENN